MPLKSINHPIHHLAIAGLAVSIGASIPGPVLARSVPASTTCQATIQLGQGASLIYHLTGVIAERTSPNTPQNLVGRTTTMTVQRRDRNGRVTTLLDQATVQDYEQIAPDADYSELPFSPKFRGKPNDGFRMYGVTASQYGLYASLRPTEGQPQKMQIVHYTNSGKFIRSTASQCSVASNLLKMD
jgi:hypothetical protein